MSHEQVVVQADPADQQKPVRSGYRRGTLYRLACLGVSATGLATGCYQQPTLLGEYTLAFVTGGTQHCLAKTDWTTVTDSEHHAAQLLVEPGTDVVDVIPFVDGSSQESRTLRVVHSKNKGAYPAPVDKASVVILTTNGCVFSPFVNIPPPAQP